MAKEQFNVYLPTEVIAMVRQLATTERGELSNSAVVESAIRQAHAALQPQKRVEPVYVQVGKRQKLVGFNGWYGDTQVAFEEATESLAQSKVDQVAFDAMRRS